MGAGEFTRHVPKSVEIGGRGRGGHSHRHSHSHLAIATATAIAIATATATWWILVDLGGSCVDLGGSWWIWVGYRVDLGGS